MFFSLESYFLLCECIYYTFFKILMKLRGQIHISLELPFGLITYKWILLHPLQSDNFDVHLKYFPAIDTAEHFDSFTVDELFPFCIRYYVHDLLGIFSRAIGMLIAKCYYE